MHRKIILTIFVVLVLSPAAIASDSYQAEDIVIGSSRIELDQQPSQIISVEGKSSGSRPSLDAALQGQSNIQIVPTPLRGSNLSLGGMSGEHVGLYWNGDPILGRVDGALDTRMISLDSIGRIAVYQGLDSLPYGSQNIGGVISLESPWETERLIRLRSAGGNYGRSIISGQLAGETASRLSYSASAINWRTDSVRINPDAINTSSDASAKFAAGALTSKMAITELAGESVDVRIGGTGFHDNSRGVFTGELTEGNQQRVHVYSDIRRKKSVFHVSYSEYQNDLMGLGNSGRQDSFKERAIRIGPELQEKSGNTTFLAGSIVDIHSTQSSRISALATPQDLNRITVGTHGGLRHAFGDHWVAGIGTRWDTGPRLLSPRGEVRYLYQTGLMDHSTVLESGLGFREVTPKEQYMSFSNPSIGYRVVGNPALQNERAWMTALRHIAKSRLVTLTASVFQVRVRNAIGYQPVDHSGTGLALMTYSNISQTLSHGASWQTDYRFFRDWEAGVNYQFLRGRNLENNSQLFLQPEHRVALTAGRNISRGISLLGQAVWTGQQGFFDSNRNRVIDDGERAAPYWMTNIEAGYGFPWSGVSELIRIFGRVDNVLNVVNENTFPLEPRTFLLGAVVEL